MSKRFFYVFSVLLLLTIPAIGWAGSDRVYNNQGQLVGRVHDHGSYSTIYDNSGHYLGRIKHRDSGEDDRVYDSKGRYQGRIHEDRDSGEEDE